MKMMTKILDIVSILGAARARGKFDPVTSCDPFDAERRADDEEEIVFQLSKA
jgi:hypothetical protein